MRVQPVSGDMLIKLGLVVAAAGAVYLVWRKAANLGGDVIEAASEVADAVVVGINPTNHENIVNRGVSAVGGAVFTSPTAPGKNADGSWTLGGSIYDLTHADAVTGKWWWQ